MHADQIIDRLDSSMASRGYFSSSPTKMTSEFPFPPHAVQLTSSEECRLTALADKIVSETLKASEDFEAASRQVNTHAWKLVKERENMHIYRASRRHLQALINDSYRPERPQLYSDNEDAMRDFFLDEWIERRNETRGFSNRTSETPSSSSSSSGSDRVIHSDHIVVEASQNAQVPLVLGTGIVEGSVEDMALGALASTDRMWQLRGELNKGVRIKHSKILATIHKPTQEDPFRFLGVKWSSRSALEPLLRQRDFLDIESTGITSDINGQRVFYYLLHSIELPQVPEFTDRNIVRGRKSLCVIGTPSDSQNPSNATSLYCLCFLDGRGMVSARIMAAILGNAITSIWKVVEMSNAKKLAWLIESKQQQTADSLCAPSTECACCSKRFVSITNPYGSRARCGLCKREICKPCSIEINVALPETTNFCVDCVHCAERMDARQVALNMLAYSQAE